MIDIELMEEYLMKIPADIFSKIVFNELDNSGVIYFSNGDKLQIENQNEKLQVLKKLGKEKNILMEFVV